MNELEKERALISFLFAITEKKDYEYHEQIIIDSIHKVASPHKHSGNLNIESLQNIRASLNKFNALSSHLLDKLITDRHRIILQDSESKPDEKINIEDDLISKLRLKELMTDKSKKVTIGLSTLLTLFDEGKIKGKIKSGVRKDRLFSLLSAIAWAKVHSPKNYQAIIKNLKE